MQPIETPRLFNGIATQGGEPGLQQQSRRVRRRQSQRMGAALGGLIDHLQPGQAERQQSMGLGYRQVEGLGQAEMGRDRQGCIVAGLAIGLLSRVHLSIEEIARTLHPVLQGCIQDYGRFYKADLISKLYRYLDPQIAAWLRRKYKRLRGRWRRNRQLLK